MGNLSNTSGKFLSYKFMGLWPREKYLIEEIKHKWNFKGHYDLMLGSKGFSTIIFNDPDKYIITLKGGPYFEGGLQRGSSMDQNFLPPS